MGFTANSWGSPGYGGTEGGGGSTIDATPIPVNTFGGSWTVDEAVSYQRKISGVVSLEGALTGGVTTVGTTLFTLPAGRRPTGDFQFYGFGDADQEFVFGFLLIKIAAATGAVTIAARAVNELGVYPNYISFADQSFS